MCDAVQVATPAVPCEAPGTDESLRVCLINPLNHRSRVCFPRRLHLAGF